MTAAGTLPPESPPTSDRVSWSDGVVLLRDERLFGPGGERECNRFLGRVLSVEGVRSVALDRSKRTAAIRHDAAPRDLDRLLRRLSDAIRNGVPSEATPTLPRGVRGMTCIIHRYGTLLSTCEVVSDRPGRLRLRHEALRQDRALAQRVELRLSTVPGVERVSLGVRAGSLLICYDSAALRTARLVRLTEEALDDSGGWGCSLPEPTRTRFGPANATLGIAALADFAVPALMPVSGILLVGTNLRTFRAAWLQFVRREVGLALLYTVIVVATLVSGQFFASALMSWFFKFWHDRLRLEMAIERRRLLDECLPRGRLARLATPDGREVMLPIDRLQLGYQVMVGADEPIPADGRVVEGEAVVDERSVRGRAGASRKRPGDVVLFGSTVLAGSVRVEVTRPGDRTRASAIAHALVSATSPAAGPMSPTLRSEAFANRAVGPTLATAGLGLLVGDLSAVGAILRPDYATGPGLALPLETLRDAALCSRRGIVVRSPEAFERLGEVDLIVLVDSPVLRRFELEVVEVQTQLPEAELLRYATSAFRHLADDRAVALAAACRGRRIHLLNLRPVGFDPGVTVVQGKRRIQVRDYSYSPDGTGPLVVEIDGTTVGLIRFGRSSRLEATASLQRIHDLAHVPVMLLSDQGEAEVSSLARSLGAATYLSGLTPDAMARLLRECRERGLRTAFVGDCRLHSRAAAEAHVAVSMLGDSDLDSDPGAVLLLDHRLDLLADLWEISRSHAGRVHFSQAIVLVPNVLCVAGAFLFGFTGLTAVMISNLGTFGLYSRAVGSLRELEASGRL